MIKIWTWQNNWIWEGESIWCSIEKFRYSNELTNSEFCRYINATPRQNFINDYYSLCISNYSLKKDIIIKLLNKDIFSDTENVLKNNFISNIFPLEKCIVRDWRFCPECIKLGYHSIFHQLNLYDKCIFHHIDLETHCPNCNKVNTYSLKSTPVVKAFSCNCGYNYLENKYTFQELIKIWSNSSNFISFNNMYILKDLKNKYFYTSYNFYYEKYIKKNSNYYIKNNTLLYKVLNLESNIGNICSFNFRPKSYKFNTDEGTKNNIYDSLDYIMIDRYVTILKSIAKHIRKSISKKSYKSYLSKNIYFYLDFNISNMNVEGKCYKDIDEYLYAYIMWRKNVEGHSEYYYVHSTLNFLHFKNIKLTIQENILDVLIYKYIIQELRDYKFFCKSQNKEIIFSNFDILLSAFERIIGKVLLDYFNDWLKFIRNKKQNSPNDIINFNESIPIKINDFLISYKESCKIGYLIDLGKSI